MMFLPEFQAEYPEICERLSKLEKIEELLVMWRDRAIRAEKELERLGQIQMADFIEYNLNFNKQKRS